MIDGLTAAIEGLMGSPWLYLALFGAAALDAFFPIVPSETLVVSAGVFAAATGEPNVLFVILVAAAGAFIGDHISYAVGRYGGRGLLARFAHHRRIRQAIGKATSALAVRGGLVLVVSRYIPGGRTAVTLTCGLTACPPRRFSSFDSIAAGSWAVYSVVIGYLAGHWFDGDPIRGVLAGIGLALGVTAAVELVRYVRRRRTSVRVELPDPLPKPVPVP